MKVVLAGGGTAGHIEPALATADAVRRADPEAQVTLLGTERGLEVRLVPERGYELALIPPVPLPRRPTPELLRLPMRVRASVRQTTEVLRSHQADVLVGFGGYVALPAYVAARRLGVPIVVHEANAKPGLANRIGARFTSFVGVASPGIELPHAQHVGIPLRRSIALLDRDATRAEARDFFGLDPSLPTLLVFGGSQGARRINEATAGALRSLLDAGFQVLHAVGRGNVDAAAQAAAAHGIAVAGGPTGGESPATGASATGPAGGEQSATGPAATGPAVTGTAGPAPSATQPPATEPPATEPPATGPGAAHPSEPGSEIRSSAASQPRYVPVAYVDRMDLAYAAADLAVCRAGAITCAELAAVGLPAVYVPLPHGNGEQRFNALPTVAAGGGVLIADGELTSSWLTAEVTALLGDRARLDAMGAAAATLGRRDADDRLVEMVRRAAAQKSVGG
ncbi:UDP-N-acetylglucosamine--N-acetylmuramyl-(pentapeptide) pyrophosphoryl-undecaprenol N-acetylglucosamine transferase [Jiangella muralis]|uniref:UDP-N-acetylglucosamine--N-acetylmuramyl- (pentapeptide) pyrophosphoryl-undecaprenol N-acetylglucosamine transferase n=1 Tax=Jiangella muralis TaxID=702383 RepID=UPI00069DE452|nr:UDP-N-acetylglucosamine--N-acetylmuramyl-(pentapeptide) pyrophosphoryl-undecaprenol N-acetylglucosamine transferase [Jiangella muralis]